MPNTGRPSTGCGTCRRRKVKCDEGGPPCSNCIRIGRICPGYQNLAYGQFRVQVYTPSLNNEHFGQAGSGRLASADSQVLTGVTYTSSVREDDHVQSLLTANKIIAGESGTALDQHGSTESKSRDLSPVAEPARKIRRNEDPSHIFRNNRSGALDCLPYWTSHLTLSPQPREVPGSLRLGFSILSKTSLAHYCAGRSNDELFWRADSRSLATALDKAISQNSGHTDYMTYLPMYYGHDECLDLAATCLFTAVSTAFLQGHDLARRETQQLYARALKQLRTTVENYEPAFKNVERILAAIMLLVVYESITSDLVSSWTRHMTGMSALFASRGPDQLKSTFETDILLAALPGLVMEAYIGNHPCFLEEDIWQSWLRNTLSLKFPDRAVAAHVAAYLLIICQMPGLISTCHDIVDNPLRCSASFVQKTIRQARDLREQFLQHLPPLPAGLYAQETSGTPIWFVFDQSEQATAHYSNFLANICTLNRIILSLSGSDQWLEVECQRYSRRILELSQALLDSTTSTQPRETDPRNRIVYLRFTFAILQTKDIFEDHILKTTTVQTYAAVDGVQTHSVIDKQAFKVYHDLIRGIKSV